MLYLGSSRRLKRLKLLEVRRLSQPSVVPEAARPCPRSAAAPAWDSPLSVLARMPMFDSRSRLSSAIQVTGRAVQTRMQGRGARARGIPAGRVRQAAILRDWSPDGDVSVRRQGCTKGVLVTMYVCMLHARNGQGSRGRSSRLAICGLREPRHGCCSRREHVGQAARG